MLQKGYTSYRLIQDWSRLKQSGIADSADSTVVRSWGKYQSSLHFGDDDIVLMFPGAKDFVDNYFKNFVPNSKDVVYLHDGGHFIQQEQATKVNELLIAFFKEHVVSTSK